MDKVDNQVGSGLAPNIVSYVLPLPGNSKFGSKKRKSSTPKKRVQTGRGKRKKTTQKKGKRKRRPQKRKKKFQVGGKKKRKALRKNKSVSKNLPKRKGKSCSYQRQLKRA